MVPGMSGQQAYTVRGGVPMLRSTCSLEVAVQFGLQRTPFGSSLGLEDLANMVRGARAQMKTLIFIVPRVFEQQGVELDGVLTT